MPLRRRRWRSFDRKLPLLASGLVLLTAAVLAFTSWTLLRRALVRANGGRLRVAAAAVSQLVSRPGALDSAQRAAHAELAAFALGRGSRDRAMAALTRRRAASDTMKVFAALLDSAGAPLLVHERSPGVRPRLLLESVRRGEVRGDSASVGPLESLDGVPGVSYARPLRDSAGRIAGYVVESRSIASMRAIRPVRDLVGHGTSILIGQPGAGVWTDHEGIVPAPPVAITGDTVALIENGVGVAAPIPGTPWFVWLAQSDAAVMAPTRTLLWSLLPLGLAIALVGAALMYGMARNITHPLAELTEVAEGIARDTHAMPDSDELPAVVRGADEITRLRFAFQRMADRVAERQALEQQLRHGQKMEAVGRLAGGIAHDFNNLLTAIRSYADLMLDDMPPYDPKRGDVLEIRKAAERAAALTSQLLAFSRKSLMQPRVLDTRRVLEELRTLLSRLMVEDVRLEVTAPDALWPVKADRGQFEQVIVNLAVNGRDAMPDGGTLQITARNETLAEPVATREGPVPPGEYVTISVTDTGIGMDTTTQNRVFEPFFTTKPVGQGTGLGLATVHGIVAQSGGHVTVASMPSRGSTFTVYLPRAFEKPGRDSGGVVSAARGNNETVLLVEDEASVRALARRVLVRAGFRVIEASAPSEAMRLAEAHGREIQLVLSDVVMPEMSGPSLVAKLAPLLPGVRVLFISGYNDDEVIGRGLADPGVALLQKPFSAQQLVERVREALDGVAR